MKTTVEEIKEKEEAIIFPCLMKMDEIVVLFTGLREGTVVIGGICYPPGYHSTGWYISQFTPFKGKVILSND